MDPPGIEPGLEACHAPVMPFYYGPLCNNLITPATHSIYIAAPASIIYSLFEAPVAQWIEHCTPNAAIEVRFLSRAQRSETDRAALTLPAFREDKDLLSFSQWNHKENLNKLARPLLTKRI